MLFRSVTAGVDAMPSPEGNKPDHFDTNPASQPGGRRDVPPPAPGTGEKQKNQEPKAILPSYYNDIFREADSQWLHPKKDKELLKGWDSFAEYAFDMADIIAKPNRPNIPKDDIEALDEDTQIAHGMTADEWEEDVLFGLDVAEDRHLIPEFKRHMQEYRKAIKGIVQLWRENGLL